MVAHGSIKKIRKQCKSTKNNIKTERNTEGLTPLPCKEGKTEGQV